MLFTFFLFLITCPKPWRFSVAVEGPPLGIFLWCTITGHECWFTHVTKLISRSQLLEKWVPPYDGWGNGFSVAASCHGGGNGRAEASIIVSQFQKPLPVQDTNTMGQALSTSETCSSGQLGSLKINSRQDMTGWEWLVPLQRVGTLT